MRETREERARVSERDKRGESEVEEGDQAESDRNKPPEERWGEQMKSQD